MSSYTHLLKAAIRNQPAFRCPLMVLITLSLSAGVHGQTKPVPGADTKPAKSSVASTAPTSPASSTVKPFSSATGDVNLVQRLVPVLKTHQGRIAVMVKHLATGVEFRYQADEPMPTASLIKLPIMIEAYRQAEAGKLSLDKLIEVRKDDMVPGSGVLTRDFSPGIKLPLRDLIQLMIVHSDNTATNLVIEQIGLPATTALMKDMGLPNTRLHSKVFRRDTSIDMERSKQFGIGSTTAAEMVTLLEKIFAKKALSASNCEKALGHLYLCEDHDLMQRKLPSGTKFAHKTGAVNAVRTEAGIIYSPGGPIAVCCMTADNKDQRWVKDNAAELVMAQVGEIVYSHFNPEYKSPTPTATVLKVGDSGPMVESLQRTLAARLGKEGESLGVDGDFGPQTENSLRLFQKQSGLPATGVTDTATWQKLGTLIESERPIPEPEIVNSASLPRKPFDAAMTSPPVTSCKSWAILDGATGKLIMNKQGDVERPMASTTKMMTCLIVMQLAQRDPNVLSEEITFSTRADKVPGSTAAIRAGEKISVLELLYGLMLPSGNDAAQALAEHFGPRLSGTKSPGDADPADGFIKHMNQVAQSLGLHKTKFVNPHGLSDPNHHSSANDLAMLAYECMKYPLFQTIVGTQIRGTKVTGPGGYIRNVAWKNTNEMLNFEGFIGVKTGTTGDAGACLVANGIQFGRNRIVVILGAQTNEVRYVDAHNLFRYAFMVMTAPGA